MVAGAALGQSRHCFLSLKYKFLSFSFLVIVGGCEGIRE
jgi:hypothetical protein